MANKIEKGNRKIDINQEIIGSYEENYMKYWRFKNLKPIEKFEGQCDGCDNYENTWNENWQKRLSNLID
jgi:hypothetical protein